MRKLFEFIQNLFCWNEDLSSARKFFGGADLTIKAVKAAYLLLCREGIDS